MRKGLQSLVCLLLTTLMCTGCGMQTVDQMYQLPKRSEDYSNLRSVIDKAMTGLDYCAPLAGDNQQSVQMADLDGDGEQEYLVFAKGTSELPLRILVFDRIAGEFLHTDTIESNGASFDQIEYVQMDKQPGAEIVVGRQVSDQLVRSVTVYSFSNGEAEQLLSANYRKFITVDLDEDDYYELFLIRPGQTETDNGVAEFYTMKDGVMERDNEVSMSASADKLKRILVGKLEDGKNAIYVASTVGDSSLITDIFTRIGKQLTNVSTNNDSGNSVQTLRNYYIYADDMDNDGIVELPRLITMIPLVDRPDTIRSELILWYSVSSIGTTENKLFTYYDAAGGWYLELDKEIALRVSVRRLANVFEFYQWNEDYSEAQKIMTIFTLTGQNREEQSVTNGRFVLLKTDTVIYSASLEPAAAAFQITQETLIHDFSLIHRDWNTGET